jgi:hypothetical protein
MKESKKLGRFLALAFAVIEELKFMVQIKIFAMILWLIAANWVSSAPALVKHAKKLGLK